MLILASNSPRRCELIGLLGFTFKVRPADIAEVQAADEKPEHYVRRLACQKAMSVAQDQTELVIAADTTVVDGETLLEKPADADDSRRMLGQLRGRTHQVFTAIAIVDPLSVQSHAAVCRTDVPMRAYTDAEIDAYIATGDPLDKAGAYGIQNAGFHPVEGLQGCFASVMGLPLCHLAVGLRAFGRHVAGDLPARCQAFCDYDCPVFNDILGQSGG